MEGASARLRFGLLVFFSGLHRFSGGLGGFQRRNCEESRDTRGHLHQPAEDSQTSSSDAQSGIAETSLTGI